MSAAASCRLICRWRITKADLWDCDYLDLVDPATISIADDGYGQINFGASQACLDLEYGKSIVYFTWQGFDEMDDVSGSGNVELLENGSLEIEFNYHNGNEATLNAKSWPFAAPC